MKSRRSSSKNLRQRGTNPKRPRSDVGWALDVSPHHQPYRVETEVWIVEKPDHMIHFNGDKFLGPGNQPDSA